MSPQLTNLICHHACTMFVCFPGGMKLRHPAPGSGRLPSAIDERGWGKQASRLNGEISDIPKIRDLA
jgi:hypothetical protein